MGIIPYFIKTKTTDYKMCHCFTTKNEKYTVHLTVYIVSLIHPSFREVKTGKTFLLGLL